MGTDLYTFIEEMEQCKVHCAFCSSIHDVVSLLSGPESPSASGITLALQCWQKLPGEKKLIQDVVDGLAELALQLWPDWYGQRTLDIDGEASVLSLTELAAQIEHLSVTWHKLAAEKIGEGKAPTFKSKKLKKEIQLEQLALALAPENLHIILALDMAEELPVTALDCSRAKGLAHVAHLLASCSGASVGLLLPVSWQGMLELDHVSYHAKIIIEKAQAPEVIHEIIRDDAAPVERSKLWLIKGNPHPCSQVEQKVAKQIESTPELHGLFHLNAIVKTTTQSQNPKVDMVWQEGKLVIEFDGKDHLNVYKYNNDRQRDYELFMDGYHVLRFTNEACIIDTPRVVSQIKDAVNLIKTSKLL